MWWNLGNILDEDFQNIGNAMSEKMNPGKKKVTVLSPKSKDKKKKKPLTSLPIRHQKTVNNDWCKETNSYEPKSRLIKISNKNFYLRHGKGGLGFILFERKGFTIVNTYRMKDKKFVSTARFNRKIGFKSAREYIFEYTQHVAEAVKENDKPFRASFKSLIVPLSKFKDDFKPNEFSQKSFATSTKDSALMSLNEMLKDTPTEECTSGLHSASISYAVTAIAHRRRYYITHGELPAVEVSAIWSNFNPETKLVAEQKYDRGEPLYYSYDIIRKQGS